jgi:GTP-binding protein
MAIVNAKFITSAASPSDWGKFTLPEIAVAGRSNAGKSSFINKFAGNSKLARISKEAGKTRCVNFFECRMQIDSAQINSPQCTVHSAQIASPQCTVHSAQLKDKAGKDKAGIENCKKDKTKIARCKNPKSETVDCGLRTVDCPTVHCPTVDYALCTVDCPTVHCKKSELLNSPFSIFNFHLADLPGYGYSAAGKAATEKFSDLADRYIRASENLVHVLVLVDIRIPPTQNDLKLIDFLFRCQKSFTVLAAKADKLSRMQVENQRIAIARALKMGRDDIIPISNTTGEGFPRITELLSRILRG